MRERTFIAAMVGLDMMLILAGGVMAWSHAFPRLPGMKAGTGNTPVDAVIATILIAMIGAYALYELNVFVFRVAESPATHRNSRLAAMMFAAAAIAGGIFGLTAG